MNADTDYPQVPVADLKPGDWILVRDVGGGGMRKRAEVTRAVQPFTDMYKRELYRVALRISGEDRDSIRDYLPAAALPRVHEANTLFSDRVLLNTIRLGLALIYRGLQYGIEDREAARQALARLEGRTSLDDLGPRYAVRGHYHDATGDTLCQCPEPGRYAPAPYDPEEEG